jgi:hypothetical protein
MVILELWVFFVLSIGFCSSSWPYGSRFFQPTATVMFGALLGRVADPFALMSDFHIIYTGIMVLSVLSGILRGCWRDSLFWQISILPACPSHCTRSYLFLKSAWDHSGNLYSCRLAPFARRFSTFPLIMPRNTAGTSFSQAPISPLIL